MHNAHEHWLDAQFALGNYRFHEEECHECLGRNGCYASCPKSPIYDKEWEEEIVRTRNRRA